MFHRCGSAKAHTFNCHLTPPFGGNLRTYPQSLHHLNPEPRGYLYAVDMGLSSFSQKTLYGINGELMARYVVQGHSNHQNWYHSTASMRVPISGSNTKCRRQIQNTLATFSIVSGIVGVATKASEIVYFTQRSLT